MFVTLLKNGFDALMENAWGALIGEASSILVVHVVAKIRHIVLIFYCVLYFLRHFRSFN